MAEKLRADDSRLKLTAPTVSGLTSEEEKRFYELFDRLSRTQDPEERKQIKEELAQLTYGC